MGYLTDMQAYLSGNATGGAQQLKQNAALQPSLTPAGGGSGYNLDAYLASGLGDQYSGMSDIGGNYGLDQIPGGVPGGAGGGLMDSLQGYGALLGGVGSIGQAYTAYKNFGLAEDQFDFTKQYTNRNLANQSAVVNSALRSQNRARRRLGGGDSQAAQTDGSAIG
jgi:hypothetical protein